MAINLKAVVYRKDEQAVWGTEACHSKPDMAQQVPRYMSIWYRPVKMLYNSSAIVFSPERMSTNLLRQSCHGTSHCE